MTTNNKANEAPDDYSVPQRIWLEEAWISNKFQIHYNPTRKYPAQGFVEFARVDPPTEKVETVESALVELREMNFMRSRIEYIQIFDSEFPPSTRIEISIWRKEQSGKVIYAPTLSEAMAQVRAWKEE